MLTAVSTRIAVELSDRELERLDDAVARGRFESREAAVRAALRSVFALPSEDQIADAYRRAYGAVPEDERLGEVGLQLAAERLRRDRP
jgi:Arc/MetJ-type ribon-helix-helix transcriptional regulator